MVFQINYHTEALEAVYPLNLPLNRDSSGPSAIFSLSVNEAFCVTGSED